jgi:Flp pilus assembly protein TadD
MSSFSSLHEAVRLHQAGALSEAKNLYHEVLKNEPENPEALHLLGILVDQTGSSQEAVELISKAISLRPNVAAFYSSLADALRTQGNLQSAEEAYEKALTLDSGLLTALMNSTALLLQGNRSEEAWKRASLVLKSDPKNIYALMYAGMALKNLGRSHEALSYFESALEISPDNPKILSNYGNALREAARSEEALKILDRALQISSLAEVWSNRGHVLTELGRFDEAEASYNRALSLNPNLMEALSNKALILLLQGRWKEGFQLYEAKNKKSLSSMPTPEWNGESLRGKSLLLRSDEGLGDLIQYLRWVARFSEMGARVTLTCPAGIHQLLRTYKQAPINLIGENFNPRSFDYQSSIMSLPFKLGLSDEDFRPLQKYLEPEKDRVCRWKERLKDYEGKFKVGLSWQGNPNYWGDRNRSIPLEQFLPILGVEGAAFFSLQKGYGSEQIEKLNLKGKIWDGSEELDQEGAAFIDTAALMEGLDLVITSDTSIAHLAGALGRPTWLLVSKIPDWRWGLKGSQCRWYESLRIYRQKTFRDWTAPVEEVVCDLKGNLKS